MSFRKLAISFSGGRSSAVMTKRLWDRRAEWDEVSITFANTGEEDERTLLFVHQCELHFGWPVVWLEAVIPPDEGEAIGFRIVSYGTAKRSEDHGLEHPFEAAVAKYGIFNSVSKSCTTKLKELPMNAYRRSIGYQFGKELDHWTAIGIRADEVDRIPENAKAKGFLLPLVHDAVTKRDVALEIRTWPFDLTIPGDHWGNCKFCYKKTLRKHLTLAKEDPSAFNFPARMEAQYGTHKAGPDYKAAHEGRRYWFRGQMSTEELIKLSGTKDFKPYVDDPYDHAKDVPFDEELDVGSGCSGDSCEIGMDE